MKVLSIDLETFSDVDIKKSGVYKYAESPNFEILLFAYKEDDKPTVCIDLACWEAIPDRILLALTDSSVLKKAANANFEMVCLSKHLGIDMDPTQWECTLVRAGRCGLPLRLQMVSDILNLTNGKMLDGAALIRYFCIPCKPTKSNGMRTRNEPHHNPEKWSTFIRYCIADVEAEREADNRLSYYQVSDFEKELYAFDQRINKHGAFIDTAFVRNAVECYEAYQRKLLHEAGEISLMSNPNSNAQLVDWLSSEMPGVEITGVAKEDLVRLKEIADEMGLEDIVRVITIKQEVSKSSLKKFPAMLKVVCSDGYVKGLLQFYGAFRTGRWAGRLIQIQNLARNYMRDLFDARWFISEGRYEDFEMLYKVTSVLSQLIRTAITAPAGYELLVTDFSAIEARITAWLAGEKWRLDIFNGDGKIYEASAAKMFGVDINLIKKGNPEYDLRFKGKVAELALGYQGGVQALIQMGALDGGLTEDELPEIKDGWRRESPAIVKMWKEFNRAIIDAVADPGFCIQLQFGISIRVAHDTMFITLPSGRKLSYWQPRLVDGKYGPAVTYKGLHQISGQWVTLNTYGGKIVENVVQAIARDCMATAMLRLDKKVSDCNVLFTVHDEIVFQLPEFKGSGVDFKLKQIDKIMSEPIDWAPGLPLTAEGYRTKFYHKKD